MTSGNSLFPKSAKITIIGGGPAGTATALSLLRRGLPVLVLEASPLVHPKIGETLPPNSKPILNLLGIEMLVKDAAHLPSYGNKFVWGTAEAQEKHFLFERYGSGWQIKRQHFEGQLLEQVRQNGGEVLQGAKLLDAKKEEGGKCLLTVSYDGSVYYLPSDFVVDASGRTAKFTRMIGCKREAIDNLVGLSYRFPVQNPQNIPHFTHVEAVEKGWWYAALLSTNEMVVVFFNRWRFSR